MIKAFWIRTVEPASEPISSTEAKDHSRIVQSQDDNAMTRFIQSAREEAEAYLNRGILTQTWKLTLDAFPIGDIFLPMAAPLQSVSSLKYYDGDGNLQTASTSIYAVDTVSRPGRVVRAANQVWPTLQADRQAGKIEITYIVGWTAANLVPEKIKQGMRLLIAAMEADREGLDNALRLREAAYLCWNDRMETPEVACGYAYWSGYYGR